MIENKTNLFKGKIDKIYFNNISWSKKIQIIKRKL